jgi:hypothetical protein
MIGYSDGKTSVPFILLANGWSSLQLKNNCIIFACRVNQRCRSLCAIRPEDRKSCKWRPGVLEYREASVLIQSRPCSSLVLSIETLSYANLAAKLEYHELKNVSQAAATHIQQQLNLTEDKVQDYIEV